MAVKPIRASAHLNAAGSKILYKATQDCYVFIEAMETAGATPNIDVALGQGGTENIDLSNHWRYTFAMTARGIARIPSAGLMAMVAGDEILVAVDANGVAFNLSGRTRS